MKMEDIVSIATVSSIGCMLWRNKVIAGIQRENNRPAWYADRRSCLGSGSNDYLKQHQRIFENPESQMWKLDIRTLGGK